MTTIFKGKAVINGTVEGEALVIQTPVSFFLGVNTDTGVIQEECHEHQGKSIAGNILVYSFGKGSSRDCLRLWRCANNVVAPIAFITGKADSVLFQRVIVTNLPMVNDLDVDPVALTRTGDRVKVDGGNVIMVRKESYYE